MQVEIITVNEAFEEYALKVKEALQNKDIRVETDFRNEKLGYKIREAQMQKTPYMLVIGKAEQENGTVNVRSRKNGDLGEMSVEELADKLIKEIVEKAL